MSHEPQFLACVRACLYVCGCVGFDIQRAVFRQRDVVCGDHGREAHCPLRNSSRSPPPCTQGRGRQCPVNGGHSKGRGQPQCAHIVALPLVSVCICVSVCLCVYLCVFVSVSLCLPVLANASTTPTPVHSSVLPASPIRCCHALTPPPKPILPTCSRVQWQSSGLVVPAPLYRSGAYASTAAAPTGGEPYIYQQLAQREVRPAFVVCFLFVCVSPALALLTHAQRERETDRERDRVRQGKRDG